MPLEEVILTGPAGLEIIPAASGVEALANFSRVARQFLVNRLQSLSLGTGVTILDTGAGVSKTVLALTLAADEVLVVTTPEPTAITDAYAMVKILTHRHRACRCSWSSIWRSTRVRHARCTSIWSGSSGGSSIARSR